MVELFQFEFCALRGNGIEVWGVQKKCGGHGFELQWTTKTKNSLSFSWEENNSHDYLKLKIHCHLVERKIILMIT